MWGICEGTRAPVAKPGRNKSSKKSRPEPAAAAAAPKPAAEAAPKLPAAPAPKPGVSAVEMGARQREISVSEFFTKNRHLLGFDNPRKALLTSAKEPFANPLHPYQHTISLPSTV